MNFDQPTNDPAWEDYQEEVNMGDQLVTVTVTIEADGLGTVSQTRHTTLREAVNEADDLAKMNIYGLRKRHDEATGVDETDAVEEYTGEGRR